MILRYALIFALCLLFTTFGYSQNGIQINTPQAFNGYTLLEQEDSGIYLINNCGQIVHEWPNWHYTDKHPKLLPNGNLLFISDTFRHIREYNWEDEQVNAVFINDPSIRVTYEVVLLPNQNYLCVGRQIMDQQDFADLGYFLPGSTPTQGDVVVEVDRNTGDIVWMWRIFDHVIQDRDASLANYGVVGDNPQLLDMGEISLYDWEFRESFMINGMDYNPDLDQIALSVRKMSEVVIIDHSTSTAEAAGSTGGDMGKGGDLLYRFGNPKNYDRGTTADQFLFYQHNPKWILNGEHAGKMSCFNNGLNNPNISASSVPIFEPVKDANGNYVIDNGSAFMPLLPELNYGPQQTFFFSGYTSGAEILPNGNVYVTIGRSKEILELDKTTGEVVWQYRMPKVWSEYLFRSEKYGWAHPAFTGKDLSPKGTIEQPSSTVSCEVSNNDDLLASHLNAHFNMDSNVLSVEAADYNNLSFVLFNLSGQRVWSAEVKSKNLLPRLQSGLYVLKFVQKNKVLGVEKIIIP